MSNICCGFAYKRGRKRKNWKRRYFELSSRGLYYYRFDDKQDLRGGCVIENISGVEFCTIQCPFRGWSLQVNIQSRILYMQLCSEEERKKWYNALLKCVETNNFNYGSLQESVIDNNTNNLDDNILYKNSSNIDLLNDLSLDYNDNETIKIQKTKSETQLIKSNDNIIQDDNINNNNESDIPSIKYASPSKVIYEIPEGPNIRNYKSTVFNLLPNHMNISFSAVPSLPLSEYTPFNKWNENGKSLISLCRKYDSDGLIDKDLEIICNNFINNLDNNNNESFLQTLPNESLEYCPGFKSYNKIHDLWDKFYIDYTNILEDKGRLLYPKDDWIKYKWINIYSLLQYIKSNELLNNKYKILSMAYTNNISNIAYYGVHTIIDELTLHNSEKSIKPCNDLKYPYISYEYEGMLFEFTINSNYLLNNNEFIQKCISQEFRASQWLQFILQSIIPNIIVPLEFVVKYLGFRMIVKPLLPISNDSLVYGYYNNKLYSCSDEIYNFMKHLRFSLCIKETSDLSIRDLCIHLGKDGRYYMQNISTICASEPPVSGKIGSEYYRFFRLEFLLSHDIPLNPNTYSPELNNIDDEIDKQNIIKALDKLLTLSIPRLVENLTTSAYKLLLLGSDCLLAYIHGHGINCRYLGYIRSYISTHTKFLRELIFEEIIARVYKNLLRNQIMKHHLQKNEKGSEKKVGTLTWKAIYSLFHMDEIGEHTYWQDIVLPTMKIQFGDFFTLPGNNDILEYKEQPVYLLKKFTTLVRLSKRLCTLLNVNLDDNTWKNLEQCIYIEPNIIMWERNIKSPASLLISYFSYWWEYLLTNLHFNIDEFSLDTHRIDFMKRLSDCRNDIFQIIRHIIRICKMVIYEKSCHGTHYLQKVLFFLASIVDDSADEITIEHLPLAYTYSGSLDELLSVELENHIHLLIEQENTSKFELCKNILTLQSQYILKQLKPSILFCKVLLSLAGDILRGDHNTITNNNDSSQLSITFARGILILSHNYLTYSSNIQDIEQLYLCYELLLTTFNTEQDQLFQFYYLIYFLKDLITISTTQPYMGHQSKEVTIRTYIQIFWYLQKIILSSDIIKIKHRIYSAYYLAHKLVYQDNSIDSPIHFLLQQCETVLVHEEYNKLSNITPNDFINDIINEYTTYLYCNIKESMIAYKISAEKQLNQQIVRIQLSNLDEALNELQKLQ